MSKRSGQKFPAALLTDDTVPFGQPSSRRRRRGTIALTVFGVLSILAGIGLVANLLLYKQAAAADAASLRDQLAHKVALADNGTTCTAPPPSAPTSLDDPRM